MDWGHSQNSELFREVVKKVLQNKDFWGVALNSRFLSNRLADQESWVISIKSNQVQMLSKGFPIGWFIPSHLLRGNSSKVIYSLSIPVMLQLLMICDDGSFTNETSLRGFFPFVISESQIGKAVSAPFSKHRNLLHHDGNWSKLDLIQITEWDFIFRASVT